ncbi:HAD family hydrolase [Candidatus Micrarchaeota archaeon]|nr:HAD family hydrolase [Candidatus Micrarchaeota archaeon]
MIRAIVFDMWNTLIRNRGPSLPSLIKQELGLDEIEHQEYTRLYDEAFCMKKTSSPQGAINELCEKCRVEPDPERIERTLNVIYELRESVDPFPETLEVLEKLRHDYKLAMLTNTSYSALRFALQRVPLQKYMDLVVTSYAQNLIKPDPRLFLKIAGALRLEPDEILMVGDNLFTDIYGARAVGFKAVLLDRENEYDYAPKISNLKELYGYLEQNQTSL